MKYCSECGSNINVESKFCSGCGMELNNGKQNDNKIDKSVGVVKSGISSVQKELTESKTLGIIASNTKRLIRKIMRILAYIGIIILGIMIIQPFITDKDFVLVTASRKPYFNEGRFIGELMAPIILPIIFIYLGFKRKHSIKGFLLLLVIISILLFIAYKTLR